jgi:hypothetical protein
MQRWQSELFSFIDEMASVMEEQSSTKRGKSMD